MDDIITEYCPYFEPEPLEYKLFKRHKQVKSGGIP
jgi:hypothetical protein